MERKPIESSLLASVGYDLEKQILELEFKSKKEGQPSSVYQYSNVTPEKYAEFMAAESQGKFFIANLKNRVEYPCVRITEVPPVVPAEDEKKPDVR